MTRDTWLVGTEDNQDMTRVIWHITCYVMTLMFKYILRNADQKQCLTQMCIMFKYLFQNAMNYYTLTREF